MILLLLIVLGLCLGSFVNAFVWRLHVGKDWVKGRSECTHCHHVLAPLDLVPVFSWLFLKGKCRYCHKKIEASPIVEIALPLLYIISYIFWPVDFVGAGLITFIFWLVFLVGFLALAVYDLRWFTLPNKIVFPMVVLAAAQTITLSIYGGDWRILLNGALGVLAISGIFYLLFQISKGTWIGGGDVKLGVALGLLAGGLFEGFLVLFIASIAGMLAALPLIIQGKAHRRTQLPFGPFLIFGLIFVVLFGASVIDWYSGLFYA
jgi:leader peptidase (prepilin peptidase)/N-methyltransferase